MRSRREVAPAGFLWCYAGATVRPALARQPRSGRRFYAPVLPCKRILPAGPPRRSCTPWTPAVGRRGCPAPLKRRGARGNAPLDKPIGFADIERAGAELELPTGPDHTVAVESEPHGFTNHNGLRFTSNYDGCARVADGRAHVPTGIAQWKAR